MYTLPAGFLLDRLGLANDADDLWAERCLRHLRLRWQGLAFFHILNPVAMHIYIKQIERSVDVACIPS